VALPALGFQAPVDRLTLSHAARNGFEDDLEEGRLDRAELERALRELAPRMADDPRAARVVWEAAGAIGDDTARDRAFEVIGRQIGAAQVEAERLRKEGAMLAARDVLEVALEWTPPDHDYFGLLYHPLANDACLAERWDEALDLTRRGLASLAGKDPLALYRIDLLRTWATTRIHMGLPDMATEPLDAIRDELERLGSSLDRRTRLAILRVQAEQWLATDRMTTAIREIEAALEALGEADGLDTKMRIERAKLLVQLGLAQLEVGAMEPERLADARSTLTEARSEAADPLDRFNAATLLGWCELLSGRLDPAAEWIGQARAFARSTDLSEYALGFLAALEARLALAASAEREVLRARRVELSSALDGMVERWTAARPRPGGLGFLRYSDRRFVVATLIELALRLDPDEGAFEALRTLYRVRACGSLVRRLGGVAADFDAARRGVLGPGAGALVYFTGRDRSHVFAVERDHIVSAVLPGEWPLRSAVRDLLSSSKSAVAADERTRAVRRTRHERARARLGDLLLPEEVRARVASWSALTIVGSDLLLDAPFEVLPFGRSSLGQEKPVAYLTSLAEGAVLLARARHGIDPSPATPERIAIVAEVPTAARSELPALVLEDDAAPVEQRFARRARLLSGAQATAERVAKALEEVDLLAFVTHGLRDRELERPSQILIASDEAGDDALSCDEVERLEASPCVFLGVCGSGRGPEREGAGPVAHLGGAFLFAGARAVVLSDSELQLRPTLDVLEAFMTSVAEGASPAEALRRARVTAAERGWAGPQLAKLRVIGLGHEPLLAPAPR